jgi:hypothetical protein
MHPLRRSIQRFVHALLAASLLALLVAGSSLAHTQTVDPNGNGEGFTKPISNPWAQAHCNAASPLFIAERSNGVVQFNPPMEFVNCVPGTRGHGD